MPIAWPEMWQDVQMLGRSCNLSWPFCSILWESLSHFLATCFSLFLPLCFYSCKLDFGHVGLVDGLFFEALFPSAQDTEFLLVAPSTRTCACFGIFSQRSAVIERGTWGTHVWSFGWEPNFLNGFNGLRLRFTPMWPTMCHQQISWRNGLSASVDERCTCKAKDFSEAFVCPCARRPEKPKCFRCEAAVRRDARGKSWEIHGCNFATFMWLMLFHGSWACLQQLYFVWGQDCGWW